MFERVYTVHDYYDGPRSGVADFQGNPHHYCCEWDEAADDYAESFALRPVDDETLRLALENWKIWKEWEAAFHRGQRRQETHPGLPGQNAVYEDLDKRFKAKIAGLAVVHRARAIFRVKKNQEHVPAGVFRDIEVEWSVLPNALQRTCEDARR
jgi:hypothetical protein